MTFKEFKQSIVGKNNQRKWSITNSYGAYDIYKYLRKHKWLNIGRTVTEHQFYSIIMGINTYYTDQLALGYTIKLPYLGRLELQKRNTFLKYEGGKVRTNYPIDWNATLRLWYEDKESYKKKTLIRTESKEVFNVYWDRRYIRFKNKCFMQFRPSRGLKKALCENIKQGIVDAFKAY